MGCHILTGMTVDGPPLFQVRLSSVQGGPVEPTGYMAPGLVLPWRKVNFSILDLSFLK